MQSNARPAPGGPTALWLLLAINLFNYIDRQVLASVEPEIRAHFFRADDPNAHFLTGLLGTAFLVSYMISAPIFGWLADRMSRWLIIGASVILWSAATAASGIVGTFGLLLTMRLFVGVGEGGYGPAAPTIISDLFPLAVRGRALSYFYVALPVGSAIGYAIGGFVTSHWGWQTAFFAVAPPGLLLGLACFRQRDPREQIERLKQQRRATLRDYLGLVRIRSYVLNTLAMTALTFAIGGMAFWVPGYLQYRGLPPSSRITPFPAAWVMMFIAIFFLFFNTGPSNTALANVTDPSVRATAFALNILIIHALGDAAAPPLIGVVADRTNMNVAFLVVSAMMLVAGVLWLWGTKFLPSDTAAIEAQEN